MSDAASKKYVGLTARELLMFLPLAGALVVGGIAWGTLQGDVRLLQQAQDTTDRALTSHEGIVGHPGMARNMNEQRRGQAVLQESVKNIDETVDEIKALILEDRRRERNERNQ